MLPHADSRLVAGRHHWPSSASLCSQLRRPAGLPRTDDSILDKNRHTAMQGSAESLKHANNDFAITIYNQLFSVRMRF